MKKKKYLNKWFSHSCIVLFTGISFATWGQTVQRQTISCYASSMTSNSANVSQTVGQSYFTGHELTKNTVVYQGFQQPGLTAEKGESSVLTKVSKINLWPNPASTTVRISTDQDLSACTINLKNSYGSTVFSKQIESEGNCYDLDCSNLDSGIYFVTIKGGKGTVFQTTKLIITK